MAFVFVFFIFEKTSSLLLFPCNDESEIGIKQKIDF